jgi:hypothetical protein
MYTFGKEPPQCTHTRSADTVQCTVHDTRVRLILSATSTVPNATAPPALRRTGPEQRTSCRQRC